MLRPRKKAVNLRQCNITETCVEPGTKGGLEISRPFYLSNDHMSQHDTFIRS